MADTESSLYSVLLLNEGVSSISLRWYAYLKENQYGPIEGYTNPPIDHGGTH